MGSLSYLDTYAKKRTVSQYRTGLRRFMEGNPRNATKGVHPADLRQAKTLETACDRYLQALKAVGQGQENPLIARDTVIKAAQNDVEAFLARVKDKAPKTLRLLLSTVRVFLAENEVELPQMFWRKLRKRLGGSRAVTEVYVPSNKELRQILTHMDARGKSLFLCLASSGMRLGEALDLKLQDLDMEKEPVWVEVRAPYTKTGNRRKAFISTEAREALQEWLRIRPRFLGGNQHEQEQHTQTGKKGRKRAAPAKGVCPLCGRGPFKKERSLRIHMIRSHRPVDDGRVWPISSNTAECIWNTAVEKVGLLKKDPVSRKNILTPHSLRKFCRTKLGELVSQDVAEALIGHEGYLTEVYRVHDDKDLAKFYLKAEPALLVFQDAEQIATLRKDLEESKEHLQTIMNGVVSENMQLKEKVRDLEDFKQEAAKTAAKHREQIQLLQDLHLDHLKATKVALQQAGFNPQGLEGLIGYLETLKESSRTHKRARSDRRRV